ncbi:FecR domain-containing protein [Echinicola marina]|uniref:FecR family protein n=1 Tax=Echinicola marina TaxID=2859768 RepID=UPI001CF651F5|nr:FecR family protein [Echinicola marina]UCS92011.1 FecR domain-containing protein [Echinicola marina]
MEFKPKNESDFLKNTFFIKWVSEPNDHSNRYWEKWCRNNPDKIKMFNNARLIAKKLKPVEENKMDEERFYKGLDQLILANHKSDEEGSSRYYAVKKPGIFTWGGSIAASILLLGMMMLSYSIWFNKPKEEVIAVSIPTIYKSAPKGIKKTVMLPDGSKVVLNSGSSISYPETFGNTREIDLKGQAFFDVERDTARPFIVKSGELETRVLGTSFDIKAYDGQNKLHVAVVTGKVRVSTGNGIESHITPTEAIFYDRKTNAMSKDFYDYELLVGWKEKILKFQDTQYDEVFEQLSNWYDVSFVIEKDVTLEGDYTGRFEDQSLKNVLMGMEYSAGIKFEIQGQTVLVKSKDNT